MDMNEIKIEKGIPMPLTITPGNPCGRGGKWAQLMRSMEIGDSVLVPKTAMSSIYQVCRRNGWEIRSRTQPLQEGENSVSVRLWLVALPPEGHQTN